MFLNAHSTKTRQRAAAAVSDPDQLRELIRLTRGGKDNSVYRILTAKRDALLAAERARDARRSAVDSLLASLARRSRLPFDPLYESALALFQRDWAALAADASPEAHAQAALHLATMQAVVERHHRAVADQERQLRAAAEAAALDAAAAQAAASLERERARLAADAAQPTPEPTPEPAPAPPAPISKAGVAPGSAQPFIALLRQAKAALDAGRTARAQRLRGVLAERLSPSAALPVWFDRQLQQLDARLAELKDWKTFTVVPKRAELVQRMQSLIGADISPKCLRSTSAGSRRNGAR